MKKSKKTIVVQIDQPHKKEKRSRKLLWTIPIWATAFIVVFNLIFVIIMIVSGNDNKIGEIIEIDGLSMVGIAISVWIGINVYNLFDRKEFQKLQEKVKDLEHIDKKYSDKLDEENKNLGKIGDYTQKAPWKQYILRVFELNDISNNAFADELEKVECKVDWNGVILLQEIEILSSRVYHEHHKDSWKNSDDLCKWAKEGRELVEKFNKNYSNEADSILLILLDYRVGDFWFYQGYCQKGKDRIDAFKKAYESFKKVAIQSGYLKEDNQTVLSPVDDLTILSVYYLNAIGECCEMIWEGYNQLNRGTESEALEWINKALSLLEQSANGCKSVFSERDVYYRNYACTIQNAIKAGLYDENKETMLKESRENAKKALVTAPELEKTYRTFLSTSNAEIRFLLNIKEPKPGNTWTNYVNKKYSEKKKNSIRTSLDEAKQCNQIAQQLFPNRPFFAAMSVFFMEYEMILTEDEEKRKILLKQMEKAIGIVDFYDDKSDLSKVVKNEYEGLKGWLIH